MLCPANLLGVTPAIATGCAAKWQTHLATCLPSAPRKRAPPVECGSLLPLFAVRACSDVLLASPWERFAFRVSIFGFCASGGSPAFMRGTTRTQKGFSPGDLPFARPLLH